MKILHGSDPVGNAGIDSQQDFDEVSTDCKSGEKCEGSDCDGGEYDVILDSCTYSSNINSINI